MKRARFLAALAALACACGGAATPAPVVQLAPPKRILTLEERKAAACRGVFAIPGGLVESAEMPSEHRVVRSVTVRDQADQLVQDDKLRDLPVRVGEAYDARHAHDAVRRIWATGQWADVVIDSRPEGDGIAIVFRVTPRSTIDQVFVAGASEDDVQSLHARAGGVYEPAALFSAARAIEGSYHDRGYLDAKLQVGSANAADDRSRVDVCVAATIGPLVTIGAVEFEGTTHEAELRALFTGEDGKNVPGGLLDRELLDRDVLIMSAKYYDLGYLTHTLSYRADRKGDQLRLVFQVVEGGVFRIGKLEVKGDLAAPKAAYERLLSLKRGDVFNRSKLVTDMDAMRALDKGTGRKDVELEPLTNIDSDKHTVDVTLELHDPNKTAAARPAPAPVTAANGLRIVDLAVGHGSQAHPGDRVTVHYTGSLPNGTVFDSSRTHGSPFVFVLGGGQVIKGFDQGVAGMRVGGKRRVTIPPDLAYGDRGSPPTIPPKATLVFELELMKVGP